MSRHKPTRYRVLRERSQASGRDEACLRVERQDADGTWYLARGFTIAPSWIPRVLAELSAVGLDFHEENLAKFRARFEAKAAPKDDA